MNVHLTVSVDWELVKRFDAWRLAEGFKSRSEAIAYLMKAAVPEKQKAQGNDDY